MEANLKSKDYYNKSSRPQSRLLSTENNELFMKQVVGNMSQLRGINLQKIKQSKLIANANNFQSDGQQFSEITPASKINKTSFPRN